MTAHILTGSRTEIAATMARLEGEIREAIVFVDEPPSSDFAASGEDIFAEMEPFTVKAGGADYSRQSLYERMEGE